MRIRNIKNAKEKISNQKQVIMEPNLYKGKWKELFGNDHPIMIEIGMGKGQFIKEMAKQNPLINFIGIDRFDSIVLRAFEKVSLEELPNLYLSLFDAENLENVFDEHEIERVYLNFSDPWPKKAHAKRRLTSPLFLERYKRICGKEIHFKTDNRGLFEYSLETMNENGLLLKNISLDLHKSDYPNNIMTEYEEKFSQTGPIYRLEASFRGE